MNESSRVLESNGLYVDDLSRIRVLDPETADASGLLSNHIVMTNNIISQSRRKLQPITMLLTLMILYL